MFHSCRSIQTLNISNVFNARVNNAYWMFGGCSGLKTVNITSSFNSTNTYVPGMFSSSFTAGASITMKNCLTGAGANLRYLFNNCPNLASATLESVGTGANAKLGRMFVDSRTLATLNLTKVGNGANAELYEMFYSCANSVPANTTVTWMLKDVGNGGGSNLRAMFMNTFISTNINASSSLTWTNTTGRGTAISMGHMFSSRGYEAVGIDWGTDGYGMGGTWDYSNQASYDNICGQ